MAFLVRKLVKRDKLIELCQKVNIEDIYADIPTTEFRTKEGTLSTWHINSLDELNDAVLAIAVSSSEITKMDFIVIDTSLLAKYAFEYKQTYAGQDIAIPDLQNTHYDIINISIGKLVECTKLYRDIISNDLDGEKYVIRFATGEIKDLLKEAIRNNRVDREKAPKKLKEELDKLKA